MKYKNQHWYPKGFMGEFSSDGINIYWFNGKEIRFIPYKDQCQEDYFYSRANKEKVEGILSTFENNFKSFSISLKDQQNNVNEIYYALAIINLVLFHFRSIKFINNSGIERWEVINKVFTDWIWQGLLKRDLQESHNLKKLFYYLSLI